MSREAPLELGRFLVVRVLGRGAMGVVYEAFDRDRAQTVALKALRRVDPAGLRWLKAEFRAVADIAHPNLVLLHELSTEEDEWFYTMEYVAGTDLTSHLRPVPPGEPSSVSARRSSSMPPPRPPEPTPLDAEGLARLRACVSQLARAVAFLHRAGKLYLNLKPSNVRVTPEGRVILLDSGLAADQIAGDTSGIVPMAGTQDYMSPEQALGERLSRASDWYAFGAILYECLVGHSPFAGAETPLTTLKLDGPPPSPAQLVEGVPDDLEALCLELLSPAPGRRPTGAEVLERLEGSTSTVPAGGTVRSAPARTPSLVGRDAERELLEQAYRKLGLGQAVVVTVSGASGTGKTALVRSFLENVAEQRAGLVLEGRCYERESVPFKAFDEIVDELGRHVRSLRWVERAPLVPDDIQDLARMFPALGELALAATASRAALVPDRQELQNRAFRGLKFMFNRLARRQRVVVFIDDLQWGDRDSGRLLAELLAPDERPSMMFVFAIRSEQRDEAKALLEAARDEQGITLRHHIELGPLEPRAADELAVRLLAARGMAAELGPKIGRESGGSPFWIEQLCGFAAAGGGIDLGLADLVASRTAALPPDARRLLDLVCLAGRPIEQGLAQRAAGLSNDERSALLRLRSEGLLRTLGARRVDTVEPSHDRVRETVALLLSPEARASYHLALAEESARDPHADRQVLALHFHAAGHPAQAFAHALRAAEQAEAGLAFERAAELYELALSCGVARNAEEVALERRCAEALVAAGHGERAARHFLKTARGGAGAAAIDLQRRAAEALLTSGHLDEGAAILAPLLDAADLSYPASARRAMASIIYRTAQLEVRGLEPRPPGSTRPGPEELARFDLAWSAGKGLLSFDPVRGAYFFVRAVHLALELGDPARCARGLALYGMLNAFAGDRRGERRGVAIFERARALAARLDDPLVDGTLAICVGIAHTNVGRFRHGVEHILAGLERLEQRCTGAAWERATAHSSALNCWHWLGDFGQIARVAGELERRADRIGDRFLQMTALSYQGLGAFSRGQTGQARALTERALSRWSQRGFHFQHWLALKLHVMCDLYDTDLDGARRRLESRWEEAESSGLLRVLLMRVDAELLRGTVAIAGSRRNPEDLRVAHRSAERLSRIDRPMATAAADLLRAGIAGVEGRRGEASVLYARAADGFAALELAAHAASARLRASEHDHSPGFIAARQRAEADLRARGVDDPSRFAAALAPL